ncbi:tRNA(adenine(34)) deaminase, chloroplastic [Dorcoceras hygrometricum]|uniref:tRNA(Adenine(34)) deaminase, chloroplastic n=1 Tax=Dorcoceras hygrometricum TaxID=472368 RepID=A0A2Z7BU53_9LAMI|nr:tRNA(adenine(34)) deaminase, chloroplastic [Dorcoceras hygrometricum]
MADPDLVSRGLSAPGSDQFHREIGTSNVLKDPSLCSDTTVGDNGGSGSRFPGAQRPRSETRILHQSALEDLMDSTRTESPLRGGRSKYGERGGGAWPTAARVGGVDRRGGEEEVGGAWSRVWSVL